MSDRRILSPGNCAYCDSERTGQSSGWGMGPDGWAQMKAAHDAGHPLPSQGVVQQLAPRWPTLYSVTMLESEGAHSRGPIAVCMTREAACKIVETNDIDIHETNHEFAVVAIIGADCPYGLLPAWVEDAEKLELWYRWNGTAREGQYERCEKPASLERIRFGL